MEEYIRQLPKEPSFKQQGLNGYNYNLITKEISIGVVMSPAFSPENAIDGEENDLY